MSQQPTISWAFAFVWAAPMVGAFIWAAWASEPHWALRLLVAALVQVIVLTTADRLYG